MIGHVVVRHIREHGIFESKNNENQQGARTGASALRCVARVSGGNHPLRRLQNLFVQLGGSLPLRLYIFKVLSA